jgi:uncharacterized beta-barrel protein YwiB (DUF1934 family)
MGLFGGGNSSSSTTNNYEDTQTQAAGGDASTVQSVNIKASGSDITLTDQGAIKAALDFAKNESASSQNMYQGALATVSDQNKLLANAYQQGQAGDQVSLKYAGFAVVGLAVAAAAAIAMKAK